MAPSSAKRKRPTERQVPEDDAGNRPSPYRPDKSRMTRRSSQNPTRVDGTAQNQEAMGEAARTQQVTTLSSRDGTQTPAPNSDLAPSNHGPGDVIHGSNGDTSVLSRPPFRFSYITDAVALSWADSGALSISELAASMDELQLSELFLELARSALDGRLAANQAGQAIREIISSRGDADVDLEDLFVNTIELLLDAHYKSPVFNQFVTATGIDQQRMRLELDVPALVDLGLVRTTFNQIRTRKTTNLLYRQANFNLLREESEGYAKLITEYFNTAQEASSRRDEEPFMAEDAFQRIKALVGAFDLDVGRVLDITLDVSANLLVKAYPFFIKFYRASSWWPQGDILDDVKWTDQGFGSLPSWALPGSGRWLQSETERDELAPLKEARDIEFWKKVRETGINAFFQLGAKDIVDYDSLLPLLNSEIPPEIDTRGKEHNMTKRMRLNGDRKYMKETRCLPPPGNFDAAQLLGFKLRFYASTARDVTDVLPDNVIYLAALLIKIGFISLRDLYPHLHPSDSEMPRERARLEKEKAEREAKDRPGGGMNALMMAGALADDSAPPRRADREKNGGATPVQDKKDEPREELPTPENQKLLLLKALLLIGALPEALHILGRFPWLADVDLSLPPFLHRIAKHMLSKISESLRPLHSRASIQAPKEQLADTITGLDGKHLFIGRPPKKTTRWLHNDIVDKDDGFEYKHYYTDWSDNVPVCQSIEDVFLLCNTFMGYLGARIGEDAALYGSLLRIAHHSLAGNTSEENRSRWLDLLKRQLVPALSCSNHNPQLAQQLYEVLSLFPLATRYHIYSEWFTGRTTRVPAVRSAFAKNRLEARDVLRRVANDTIKKQSRALGKIVIASPGIVMTEMIQQLESYSNMIPSLVECTRYFSQLAWDVLIWALINSLGGMGRDRIQADGMLTSSWLQALSHFVAKLFSRYSHLSLSPVLQYLASELKVGNSTDLELLEQVLVEMAGIRADVEFNDSQVVAMAGRKYLRTHILSQLSDTRHLKQKEASRLIKALSGPGLIGQILIAIAQERQMYANHESSRYMPLKVLGNNLDKIHAIFQQYLEVLWTNLDPAKFESSVPEVSQLIDKFKLEPGIALTVHRHAIQARMEEFELGKKQELGHKKAAAGQDNDDTTTSGNGKSSAQTGVQATTPKLDIQSITDEMEHNQEETAETEDDPTDSPWHPVLDPIIRSIQDVAPDLQLHVSVPFYTTFWTLTLQDVLLPMDMYTKEINRLESQIAEITNNRSDATAIAVKEREKKKKTLQEVHDGIKAEPAAHLSAYIAVRARISRKEKFHWFPNNKAQHAGQYKAEVEARHLGLLQECFIPRAIMSSIDAQFAFQMVKILHDNGTPGYSLMHLLVQLFKKQELTALLFQCTANEAQHFGRFLSELLKHVHSWHAEKKIYEKEALGQKTKLPGFVKIFDEDGKPKVSMEYENFRRMLFNCHVHLDKALQACFGSGEYMHIRNGIIVLKTVHHVFPAVKYMGNKLVETVTTISKEDSRQDLKLAAMSLLGPLKNREKSWVLPQAFRSNESNKDNAKPSSRAASAQPGTPQPGPDTLVLHATTPDFNPASLANGRKASVAGGPEDGEIEDVKLSNKFQDKPRDLEPTVSETKTDMQLAPAKDAATNDSKLSYPLPIQSRTAENGEGPPRTTTLGPGSASRPPQNNFQRPENGPLRASASGLAPTGTTRSNSRYSGRADEQYGRLDRPNDARPGSRDQSPGDRGGQGTPQATASRSYKDERPYDQAADRPFHNSRNPRDEPTLDTRRNAPAQQNRNAQDMRDRAVSDTRTSQPGMHPDRVRVVTSAVALPDDQLGALALSVTGPSPRDSQPKVDPSRLALINSDKPTNAPTARGNDVRHGERDQHRDRDGRPDQPGHQVYGSQRTDGRRGARAPGESSVQAREQPFHPDQQSDLAPIGPKRGRLRESGQAQSESNYGRLNGPEDVPLGPKQTNGPPPMRAGRNSSTSFRSRTNDPGAPSPTSARPQEPTNIPRGPSRQASGSTAQFERVNGPASAPGTPTSDHQVHPSRAAQLGQPPPIQTNLATPHGPRNATSPSFAAPSGPRGGPPDGTPTGPSPVGSFPPSGPSSLSAENQRMRMQQHNAINNRMQTGGRPNGQIVTFKGASTRQPSATQPPTGPGSTATTGASNMGPPQIRQFDARSMQDDAASRNDLFQNKGRNDDGNMRGHNDQVAQHHGSRDPSREPRPDMNEPQFHAPRSGIEESRDHRGPRSDDRRPREDRVLRDASSRRDTGSRDAQPTDRRNFDRQPRGPPTEMAGPSNGQSAPAVTAQEWERGPRRDGQDDTRRGGRGGGMGRGGDFRGGMSRREDDRRESGGRMPRDDVGPQPPEGRKRRHEESPFDSTKRRRGGR